MLPCSVRRVAATGSHQSPLLSTLPRATVTRSYRPSTRRRYSSSKPSRDNGSEDPPVRQSVQPAAEAKTGKAKASGDKRQSKKTKDTSDKLKFPSVPTTAHIPSDLLALSSFFSLHRPISVTRGLPRNVTEGAFASIFVAPSRSAKAAEVISTLSRTVDDLDNHNHTPHGQNPRLTLSQQAAIADAEAHNEQIDLEQQQQRLDLLNAEGVDVSVQVNNMAGQFLPFRPPPLPQAESAASQAETAARIANAADESRSIADLEEEVQKRVYKAVFTIEETTDAHGEVKIVAHSPELIEDIEASSPSSGLGRGKKAAKMTISVEGGGGRVASLSSSTSSAREQEQEQEQQPRSFLQRMRLRQLNFQRQETRLQRPRWYLISVKRQRKLKMKKKKYKKLTRRLRHDRLKQGRT